jgi:hypothetical protein
MLFNFVFFVAFFQLQTCLVVANPTFSIMRKLRKLHEHFHLQNTGSQYVQDRDDSGYYQYESSNEEQQGSYAPGESYDNGQQTLPPTIPYPVSLIKPSVTELPPTITTSCVSVGPGTISPALFSTPTPSVFSNSDPNPSNYPPTSSSAAANASPRSSDTSVPIIELSSSVKSYKVSMVLLSAIMTLL